MQQTFIKETDNIICWERTGAEERVDNLTGTYVCSQKHNYIPLYYVYYNYGTTTCFGHHCWPSSGCT